MASIYERIGDMRKRMPGHNEEALIQDFKSEIV